MAEKEKHIIISGGGTGGHLFPAMAIAEALRKLEPNVNIRFVGAVGKIEATKVPEAGYEIDLLPVMGFPRKLSGKIFVFFVKLYKSMRLAKSVVSEFKPDVAVGVGGYASGPILKAASKIGVPTLIQEQNSYPGVTNKILAKKASKICVAYEGMERFFPKEKIILTGNPIRENLSNQSVSRNEAVLFFGLNPEMKTILSLGGSGGARSINTAIGEGLKVIADADVQIIWQTGAVYFEDSNAVAKALNSPNVKVFDFINRMDMAFKAADLVISRAGASTISELCMLGKAAVLVPSPNVAEDHQTKNAMALVNQKAAILVKDIETGNELIKKSLEVLKKNDKIDDLSKNIYNFAQPLSAQRIAKEVLSLIKPKMTQDNKISGS